jgi:hypothetical protein
MGECKNSQKPGANNPIQSAIIVNDHGTPSAVSGDNTIPSLTCDASVAVGNIVRINGSTIVNAQADSFVNSKAIGICVAKSDATTCDVQVTGFTSAILAGLTTNTNYFLSDATPGALTLTAPSASGSYVIKIGTAYTTTRIILQLERIVKRA